MPTVLRPGVFGFLIGQQLQQPIVLNLISRRITFRLSYQPSVVCKVLVVDVALHCDLQGYIDESQAAPMQHGHYHRRRTPRPPWRDGIRPYVDKPTQREWFQSRQAGGTLFLFGE